MNIYGIRQAFLCKKGTLNSTMQYAVPFGIGDSGKLEIVENSIKGQLNEDLPNQSEFRAGWRTRQMSLFTLARLIQVYAVDGGADLQVTTEKIATSAYGGVYNLEGENFTGVDFEWVESMNDRYVDINTSVSLPSTVAKTIIQSAIVNSPKDLSGAFGHKGQNLDEYKYPYFGYAHSPAGTILCNGYEIIDRKFSLKSVGNKRQYNRSKINYVKVMIELTIDRSKAQDLLDYFNKVRNAQVKIQEKVQTWSGVTYDFAEGVLYRKQDKLIEKDNGHIKLTYEKDIPVYDFVIDAGAGTVTVNNAV